MLTFGMGGSVETCTAIDIKWVLKEKKITFKVKKQKIKFNASGVLCKNTNP